MQSISKTEEPFSSLNTLNSLKKNSVVIFQFCLVVLSLLTLAQARNRIALFINSEQHFCPDTLITYSTAACFGRCPVYTFIVFKDGTAEFEGKQWTSPNGKAKGKLTEAQLKELEMEIAAARLFKKQNKYGNSKMDTPINTIVYFKRTKRKKIHFGSDAPESLEKMEGHLKKLSKDVIKWEHAPAIEEAPVLIENGN